MFWLWLGRWLSLGLVLGLWLRLWLWLGVVVSLMLWLWLWLWLCVLAVHAEAVEVEGPVANLHINNRCGGGESGGACVCGSRRCGDIKQSDVETLIHGGAMKVIFSKELP